MFAVIFSRVCILKFFIWMPFLVFINVKKIVIHVLGLLNSCTGGYGEKWKRIGKRVMNECEVWYVLRESRWGSKVAGNDTVDPLISGITKNATNP